MRRVKILFFIFITFKLTILCAYLLYKNFPLQLIHFEHLAMEDVVFNDIYYSVRPETDKSLITEKEVVLINSGTIPTDSFRLKLAYVITEVNRYKPDAIGIDMIFENNKDIFFDSVLNATLAKNKNIVLPINGINRKKQIFETSFSGVANFPTKENESVREYYTKFPNEKDTIPSFASLLCKIKDKAFNNEGEINFLKYSTVGKGYYNALKKNHDVTNYNFPALEAVDILNKKDTSLFRELLFNKIVIIGHLGNNSMDNANDVEDKHRVPTDSTLINRAPIMPGAVIHANAVQMFLTRNNFIEIKGWLYELITNLILILYLCVFYSVHHKFYLGKLINILIILGSTIPIIFIFCVYLMNIGIYYKMGALFLQIAFLEEYIEIAEGFRNKFKKKHLPDGKSA
jgi:CHASE2 domain-containing sensor protein